MSYTQLVLFKNGIAEDGIEFGNAWGGAARIWDALFTKYIPKKHEYDGWLQAAEDGRLWTLGDDDRLTESEKACYEFCCDSALVRREDFPKMAAALREFAQLHPTNGIDHLSGFAKPLDHLSGFAKVFEETTEADFIGLHATSVCENPWCGWDEELDEAVPYNVATGDKHWFLFEVETEQASA